MVFQDHPLRAQLYAFGLISATWYMGAFPFLVINWNESITVPLDEIEPGYQPESIG